MIEILQIIVVIAIQIIVMVFFYRRGKKSVEWDYTQRMNGRISDAEQSYFSLSHWFQAVVNEYGEDGKLEIKDKFLTGGFTYFKIKCHRKAVGDLTLTVIKLDKIDVDSNSWRDHYSSPLPKLGFKE